MNLTINGEPRQFDTPLTVEALLGRIGMDSRKVAVERNLEIVPKSRYYQTALIDGDRLEIVHFIGGGAPDDAGGVPNEDTFDVAGRTFRSRLIVGTGKYKDYEQNRLAV